MQELIRLSKLMSLRNICSRREAEYFIENKQVMVDSKLITEQGTKVSIEAKITLLDAAKKKQNEKVTVLLNKPVGYVSCMPEKGYKQASELITKENLHRTGNQTYKHFKLDKLSVAGRLDIDSKGLLVLTQDGVLAKKIIGENSNIEKEYLVRFSGEIDDSKIKELCFGLSLYGKDLKKAKVKLLNEDILQVILKEGKKRQIRKMLEAVDLKVLSLKRVRIGKVTLSDLPLGKWRFLDKSEEF